MHRIRSSNSALPCLEKIIMLILNQALSLAIFWTFFLLSIPLRDANLLVFFFSLEWFG